jgi:hypothetical protein
MELDDLLKNEGLDAAGLEEALAWARRRAAELVREVDGDPELGPLLAGASVVAVGEIQAVPASRPAAAPSPASEPARPAQPIYSDLRGLQAAILAEADDADDDLPEVGAVLRAFKKGARGSGPVRAAVLAEVAEAGHDDLARSMAAAMVDEGAGPTEPSAEARAPDEPTDRSETVEASVPPQADLDPLAGIDFDDLPGVDEDEEDDDDHTYVDLPSPKHLLAADARGLEARTTLVPADEPDATLPSMQAPLADLTRGPSPDDSLPGGEVTATTNPLLRAEPELATSAADPLPTEAAPAADAAVPVETEEIELLDDEDLLLVEDEEEPEEEPEWKQALVNAHPQHEKAAAKRATAGSDDGDDGDGVDLGDL